MTTSPYTAGPPVTDVDYAFRLGEAKHLLTVARAQLSTLMRYPLSAEHLASTELTLGRILEWQREICRHAEHDLSPIVGEQGVTHFCRACGTRLVRDDGSLVPVEAAEPAHV